MKRILITKDLAWGAKIGGGTIAGVNEINLLDAGAIAMFTEDNRYLDAATAAATFAAAPNTKAVYIAVGTGAATTGAKLSGLIDRMSIDVRKQTYVAPVLEVQFIGEDSGGTGALNLPSPLVVGDEALIRFTNTSTGTMPPESVERFSYQVKTGDTAVEILAGLIAKINATKNGSALFTAALVGASVGISLTAKDFGITTQISLDGVLADSTIEKDGVGASVAIVYSVGEATDIASIEFECNPVEGDTNRVYQPAKWFTKPSDVDASTNYDSYVLTWVQSHTRAIGSTVASVPSVIVAIPTGAATIPQADLETVFAQAFGVARINVETGI